MTVTPSILPRRRNRGFALLITIVLLAFLVLLLVSLATLTRVETQVAGNSQHLSEARQNALTALNIALGQLQLYAGPDQRVTTPASFGEGATSGVTGLVTPVAGGKQWLGVWGNADPADNIYAASPKPVLLNWLISGNEQTSAPVVAADGHVTSTPSGLTYQPDAAVAGLSTDSTATDTNIKIGGNSAVLLVGPATAGTITGPSGESAVDRYVVAPLVDIKSSQVPGLAGSAATIGRYAYWVGDEGVKAQYNLRDALDPASSDNKPGLSTDATQARTQLLTPARNGIEVMSALGTYPVNNPSLDGILNPSQIRLADTKLIPAIQQAESATLTTGSWGVLANSQSGGLRTDLTQLFNESTLPGAYSGKPVIPAIAGSSLSPALPAGTLPGGGTQATLNPAQGPTWDTLKSFYALSQSVWTGTPVEIRTTSATATGIAPVIVQNRLMFNLRLKPDGGTYPNGHTQFWIQTQPLFVLGNPYSFPIRASGGVEFSYGITTSLPDHTDWGLSVFPHVSGDDAAAPFNVLRFDTTKYQYQGHSAGISYFPLLSNDRQNGATPAVLNGVRFKTPAFTLQPGQVLAFSMNGVQSGGGGATATLFNLKAGVDPNAYYEYDTGTPGLPSWYNKTKRYTYLVELLSAEAMTLQMAMPGSSAADGALAQPQTGVLQAIVNADLSANNASRIKPGSDLYRPPPFPGSMDTNQSHNLNPKGVSAPAPANYITINPPANDSGDDLTLPIGGYATWLSLPIGDTTLYPYDLSTFSLTGSFRAYADYNLAALNCAMPPVAPLLSTRTNANDVVSTNVPSTDVASTFETVPPYARKYLRGPATTSGSGSVAMSIPWSEGVLTPDWGSSTLTGSGQDKVVLYDAPRPGADGQASLFSLGQLQHADLTGDDDFASVGYQPRYAVGNSFFNPFVSRDASVQSRDRLSPARVGSADIAAGGTARLFDLSYLLNAALWDGCFFSTLQQSGSSRGQPANQRLTFAQYTPTAAQLGIGATAAVADLSGNGATLSPEQTAARYLLVKGAFNINSTSVEAWKAVLAGANNLPLNGDAAGVPFARSLNQPLGSADADDGQADTTYAGYRRLTTTQIATLAKNIVAQIRARGPFLSLAHFVNRSLAASTNARSAEGALQAAIDASNLNAFTSSTDTAKFFSTPYAANGSPSDLGNRSTGAPGWLTQADLLQSLGSVLSARSDTFTVRAYGEVVNPLDPAAAPTARAWCEAVVQRFPDYVDPTVSAAAAPNAQATTRNFGRKFRIISFRWLNPGDI